MNTLEEIKNKIESTAKEIDTLATHHMLDTNTSLHDVLTDTLSIQFQLAEHIKVLYREISK